MTQTWKNNKGEVAIELAVDETTGIILKVSDEEKTKHGKEIEELQTLNMYPPKDEEKIKGVVGEDGLTTYQISPGKNWEFAQKDIVATCNFWMGGLSVI